MNEGERGFDVAIGVTRFNMRLHGIWPGYSASKNQIARYAFLPTAFMILFFINIPQTVQIFRLNGELNGILNVLTLANVPISIALAKLIGVGYNEPLLHQLITDISEDWQRTTKASELSVMWKKARTSRLFSIVCVVLGEGTTLAYSVRMFYVMARSSSSSEEDASNVHTNRPMYMNGKFPYDTQSSPSYEITWMLQIVATLLSSGTFSAVDSFFVTSIFHLCGQLINLQASFKDVGRLHDGKREDFMESWNVIINKHRRINEFADILEYSFNKMFLFQVLSSTILLCLQGYLFVITISSGQVVFVEMVFMLYFTVCFTFSIFVYCYMAELLREEATKLGDAIFYSEWYNLPARDAKLMLISLLRVKKPLQITAGKFCIFSLNLFCNIVKTAAGYMSMLLAMRDKLKAEV